MNDILDIVFELRLWNHGWKGYSPYKEQVARYKKRFSLPFVPFVGLQINVFRTEIITAIGYDIGQNHFWCIVDHHLGGHPEETRVALLAGGWELIEEDKEFFAKADKKRG